jgi:acid phosphatase type 7
MTIHKPGTFVRPRSGVLTIVAALACALMVAWPEGSAATFTLVRGPYLQQVGSDQAIVVWATREAGTASVQSRLGSGSVTTTPAVSTFRSSSTTGITSYYQHEATLTGLAANSTYEYDLRVSGEDVTPGVVDHLRTAPAAGTGTIRFVALGDSGNGSSAQVQIAGRLDNETFDLAVHNGDVAYSNGTFAQFDAFFFRYYGGWLRERPIFPSIGNHDDRTSSAGPYRTFFALPRDGASAAYPNNAERFYSFDYGPVHFIALDSEAAFLSTARRQEQVAWLAADLEASQNAPWRVAFFHRPPYSSGLEHGSDLAIRQAFSTLFERYNVQLVLNGHEHSYERSVPWRDSTDATRQAVTYVITGAAGAGLYPVGRSAWTAFSRSVHHYVRGTVSSSDLSLEAVDASGAVIDRFSLNRAEQESDSAAPGVAIVSPSSGATLNGPTTVEVDASDDSRVEKVDLWIDGKLRGIDLTAPYEFAINPGTWTNGTHTLEARAYDIAGKRASARRTISVAN